jgi:molybdopterin-binding protein
MKIPKRIVMGANATARTLAVTGLGAPSSAAFGATRENRRCGIYDRVVAHFRISDAAVLLGVSDDTVRRWVDAGSLSATTDAAGRKVVDGAELAEFARQQASATPDPSDIVRSARNRFVGLVTAITADTVMAQVDMQCGPFRVVSLMSSEAVRELGLEVGSLAVAVVKATTVIVEVPKEK